MKINKVLQRICATTLVVATVSTSFLFSPPIVEAAGAYSVNFVDNISGKEDRSAILLEGEMIKTKSVIPTNYKFLNPPFVVKGITDPLLSPITVTPEGNITAKNLVKDVDSMTLYTVEPVFSAFLTESDTGIAVCNAGEPDARTIAMKAEIMNNKNGVEDISITELSKITMTVLSDQTDPIGGQLSFKDAVADGSLVGFNGGLASFKSRVNNVITVVVSNGGKNLELKLTADFPKMIKANSTFELTFALQNLGDLQLTVISKKKAVDTIATDISSAANIKDYLKLKAGDTQHTISSQFEILHTEKRYNHATGFKIDWVWVPDNTGVDDENVVRIVGSPADINWQVKTYPKEDNVTGKLVATVTQGSGTTAVTSTVLASIPITILGTGTYPKLEANYSHKGDLATDGKAQPITEVPSEMDVNEGAFVGFEGQEPFKFTGELFYGTGLGKAENIKIEFDTAYKGRVDISFDGSTSIYKPGTMLPPPSSGNYEATRPISVKATAAGLCVMRVYFYNKSGDLYNKSPKTYNINIQDSSPLGDPSFKSMKMVAKSVADPPEYKDRFDEVYPDGVIDFGFNVDPAKRIYDFTVPWAVESVNLTPIYTSFGKVKTYPVSVINGTVTQQVTGTGKDILSIKGTTAEIKLSDNGTPTVIYINGTAEDGLTFSRYELHITRAPQSDVASLEALTITSKKDGKDEEHLLTPVFDPITYTYSLSLPYAYREGNPAKITTEMKAVASGDWGANPTFTGAVHPAGIFARFFRKGTAKLKLDYIKDTENINTVIANVQSEDKQKNVNYTVNIKIEDPSENNALSSFKPMDKTSNELPLYNGQKFDKAVKDYYLEIPYSMDELKFELLPDDEKALAVRVLHPEVYKVDPNPQVIEYKKKGTPIIIKAATPPPKEDELDKEKYMKFDYQFQVQAESDEWTAEPYVLHITRLDPSEDSRLASMPVVNAADNAPVDTYRFIQQKTEYTFEVPFTTEEIIVSPVAVKPDLTKVTIGDTIINTSMPGKIIKLAPGKVTKIEVVVKPEAGEKFQTIYTLNVTRKAPGTEARLQKLTVNGGEEMTPDPFVPSTTRYTVSIPKGTESYTVTGIPVDPKATITVNGKEVANGVASQPITSVTATSTVTIVVTAEDAKTKMTYIVTIKDYNLMTKSDNADLSDLKINYADLAPKFKTGIDEYELYVKPETKSLDITPTVSHSGATLEVLVGSKKLTPYDGIYSSSLFINKTTFTINVTAEDGVATKKYTVNVFRDDKKKTGAFKPITAEMVDYTKEDPIVIDITNYAVIDASVFNTLKTDHPDKSILFKGNDYQLKIAGKDITDLIPHTTQYDLYFSFTTPEENLIQDILFASDKDWGLEPVYLYFDDHGPLPGKMILTVNLGREYKNDQLFWNYYNGERERIDYYGYVNTNAKGTFTVPITHLSTYMVVDKKIAVAADKTGNGFGTVDDSGAGSGSGSGSDNANGGTSGDKVIPPTGVSFQSDERKSKVRM